MWTPPTLADARRVAGNKANYKSLFGQPDNWMDAERTLNEMRPQSNPQSAIQNPQSPPPDRITPARAGPIMRVNPLDPTARPRAIGAPPTPMGQVPLGIREANPEAYWDPRTGTTVVGDPNRVNQHNVGGITWSGNAVKDGTVMNNTNNATFGMPRERRETVGGRATPPAPDMFGRQFGSAADMSNIGPDGYTLSGGKRNYAEGGTIVGLGGPRDDAVPGVIDGTKQPIRVSDGEEIVDAETRDMFGRKFFIDLKKKARKLKEEEMQFGKRDSSSEGPPKGYRDGGTVTGNNPAYERFLALRDWHNDPANVVADQRAAQDAELEQLGMRDLGGGRRTLDNQHGTGYALPDSGGADLIADEGGLMRNTGTPQRPRLEPMPDIVPAGSPWAATSGQMPDLGYAERAESNRFVIDQMEGNAIIPGRRDMDALKATEALQQKPGNYKPLPNASNVMPKLATTRDREAMPPRSEPFRSPSEKDALVRAGQDAASGRPSGVRKSDWRAFQRSPQGIEYALKDMEATRPWEQIPGTDYVSKNGNAVPMQKAQSQPVTPEQAAALGMKPSSIDSRGNMTYKPEKEAKTNEVKVQATAGTTPAGLNLVRRSDGTIGLAKSDFAPTPKQKQEAFKLMTGEDLDPDNKEQWSAAYYYARGEQPPNAAQAQAAAPAAAGPNEKHVAALKANPQAAAMFDQKFGPGSAARILGTVKK